MSITRCGDEEEKDERGAMDRQKGEREGERNTGGGEGVINSAIQIIPTEF